MARSVVMPNMGMYSVEGTLISWLRPSGANVALGEPIAEIETEKATYDIEAPAPGILHHVADVGSNLVIEGVLAYILAPGEAPPSQTPDGPPSSLRGQVQVPEFPAATATSIPPEPIGLQPHASPIARRLAAEHSIDLTSITGSGPGGRIVEADVLAAAKQRNIETATAVKGERWKVRQRIPLAGIRRAIANRLRQSMATTIQLTLTHEFRADCLVAARQRLSQKIGCDLPYDALFIKVLATALRESPELNATILNDAIFLLDEVHVGFAVAVPNGVMVPVIRDADSQPLAKIAMLVRELSERALSGRLQIDEVIGGTVTITNLGGYGVDAFTPILNPSQSAILGIGRIAKRPVIDDNRVVPGWTCVLSLTFDHRVADGVPAARLLEAVARLMADDQFLDELAEAS
jgi:pyruvate dehydrogenase E2 component (dihydrolipoamide acetyltransferase)